MTVRSARTSVRLLGVDGGGTTTVAWLAEPGCHYSVVAWQVLQTPKPSARKRPAGHLIPQSVLRFTPLGSHPRQSMSSASDWLGFDRPDDRELLAGWAADGALGPPACDCQRWRPCRRGRHARGLGRWA